MKKIVLIFAAMLAMAQMNAAPATDAATTAAEAPTPDNDGVGFDHPFNRNEDTKHWSITTSGFYFGMGVKHNWDAINNSFEIGLLNILAVNYNSLHGQNISLGAGIHHRSYSMKRPNWLIRDDAGVVELYSSESTNGMKDRSSNLNMWAVQFPLMFKQRIAGKLEVGVAGILNWNTYARVDNHYEIDKVEHDTRYKGLKQNKVNFDFMGSLTWNGTGLYCRYTPSKFFKDGYGPEIKQTWTLGVALAF